jgi:very-short-patch-repair endonuclease
MPEIIEFSNRVSYPHRTLIPMRQYGAERLDPIKTVYLPHGYREGERDAVNRPEAEEIVTRIEKLYADPQYDGRSVGVISLQGESQARLIERMLLDRVGPELMLERSVVCGDAYAFQGDERDLMFLSMVAAPNRTPGALSKEQDKRRFNVAASRARDQLWLIHSVKPQDLAMTDMRKSLLEYYLDPSIEHLEELADFDETIVNPPFESQFEQDVYLKLRERGFRVSPQVPFARYRIDLVIEGHSAKLAVECDGDQWHGPDRWEADSARQRRLERAGWTFARIAGSDFYRDPEKALESVWRECDRLKIGPWTETPGPGPTLELPITGPEDLSAEATWVDAPVVEPPAEREPDQEEKTIAISRVEQPVAPQEPPGSSDDSDLPPVVEHVRLGRGQVVDRCEADDPSSVWLRIRFEDETEFDYTEDEFRRAGFTIVSGDLPSYEAERGATPSPDAQSQRADMSPFSEQVLPSARPPLERPASSARKLRQEPYRTWDAGGLPDPRSASRDTIARYLFDIIEIEGPVTSDRLYSLFIKGAGFDRVTRQARHPLNRALFSLQPSVHLEEIENPLTHWPQRVARVAGTPAVMVRELGPRDLYTVPLNEIAAAMSWALGNLRPIGDDELKRFILDAYGLVRLTPKVGQYLDTARRLVKDADEEN